jgi:CheY-like chemotaxis protein
MPLLPRRAPEGHRILIIEDNDAARAIAMDIVTTRGDRPRGVASVEEAFQAMQEEDFCLFVVDQELPLSKGGLPWEIGGRRILQAIRDADSRCTSAGFVTPVIAWTGFSLHSDFIWGLKDLGADGFVAKGEDGAARALALEIEKRLAHAGRADHSACAALAAGVSRSPDPVADLADLQAVPPPPPPVRPPITIAIPGRKGGSRTPVEGNGELRGMQDGKFHILLCLVDAHERPEHEWSDRDALGIGGSREMISRVRATFRGLSPRGFDPIQTDRSGRVRLHPAVCLGDIGWDVREQHPHGGVRKVALARNAYWGWTADVRDRDAEYERARAEAKARAADAPSRQAK